ncbi:MAG TPA: metalloregulator ArsR/SmtB family transcription factor [Candidatus Rubrimentiphilum sp.]|nr:metalloregulator ArsR/SmtB family transcription factor [Candidatus Rubrimentiphilum sp.]
MAGPDALMRALSDPTRRAIFERIASSRETSVGALTQHARVSQPAVSQHLKTLLEARLVIARREGRNTYYRAQPRSLEPLAAWLQQYERIWTQRIDRLDSYLQDMQRKEKRRARKR